MHSSALREYQRWTPGQARGDKSPPQKTKDGPRVKPGVTTCQQSPLNRRSLHVRVEQHLQGGVWGVAQGLQGGDAVLHVVRGQQFGPAQRTVISHAALQRVSQGRGVQGVQQHVGCFEHGGHSIAGLGVHGQVQLGQLLCAQAVGLVLPLCGIQLEQAGAGVGLRGVVAGLVALLGRLL